MNQNELLRQRFNSMPPEMFQGYINNPRTGSQLKAWMKANNYQHPSMMQSSAVSPAVSPAVSAPVTQNLGMSSPRPGIPHPLAPSARVSPGGQLISPTPQAKSTGFKGYPYAGNVTPEQFTFQPSDVATGRTTAYGSGLPQYTSSQMVDPTFSAGASASQSASEQAVAESIAKSGTESAGASGLTGPQAFFANMALEAIPTRDRNKVNTPFGDQGSVPGILKGAGKGALLGSTIDTATGGATMGIPTIVGTGVGAIAGAQGTFDSTSPRQVIASSVRRPRGGLLQVPKGLYG